MVDDLHEQFKFFVAELVMDCLALEALHPGCLVPGR